jgi:hypothetical protein
MAFLTVIKLLAFFSVGLSRTDVTYLRGSRNMIPAVKIKQSLTTFLCGTEYIICVVPDNNTQPCIVTYSPFWGNVTTCGGKPIGS